jgi:hypothetical protein
VGARADVVWCAPADAQEAAAVYARGAQQYWTPSDRSAALLRDAGLPAARVHVTRPGFSVVDHPTARPLNAAFVIRSERTDAARAERIITALGTIPGETVIAERADPEIVARVRSAPLVVFADDGDPWSLLGTAALSGGALTIARAGSPFLEALPADAFIGVDDARDITDAVRSVLADPERYVERGPRAAREVARRLPDVYAGRRIRELGRAYVHGVVEARTLTMTDALAATLSLGPNEAEP